MSKDPVRAYFAAVRGHYLEAFKKAIDAATAEAGKDGRKVIIEAAAASAEGEAAAADVLPYRLDVVSLGKDGSVQPTTVADPHALPWEPADLQAGDFLADVETFVWNGCVIIGRPAPEASKLEQLREWFLRWFQREKDHHGEKPFGGVVHFMSEPSVNEDVLQVQVDLGSAPVDALIDLLEVFGKMGAKEGLVFTPEAAAAEG